MIFYLYFVHAYPSRKLIVKKSPCESTDSGSTRRLSENLEKETFDVQGKNGCHPKTSGAHLVGT